MLYTYVHAYIVNEYVCGQALMPQFHIIYAYIVNEYVHMYVHPIQLQGFHIIYAYDEEYILWIAGKRKKNTTSPKPNQFKWA